MPNAHDLNVEVFISINQPHAANGRLEVREAFTIPARGFMEMCAILGQFQALATKVREEK